MKIIPFILMLSLCATTTFSQIFTNGVFVKDGKTFEVDKKVYQFTPTNLSDVLYFSNELIVKVYTNGNFMINSFYQEVLNKHTTPEKAKVGAHNFVASMIDGTAVVVYSGGESNVSSCIISTPMTDLELYKGTFYIKVSEDNVLVFVLDGSLKSHADKKRENVVTQGYAVIAGSDSRGIFEAKVSLGSEKVKTSVIDKLLVESKDVINLKGSILFAKVDGKLIGIVIN